MSNESKTSPRIELNRVTRHINLAFGVSPERLAEIYKKFIAVANIYPNYSTIAESFLNSTHFNEKEKFFGMFVLGKTFGMMMIVKRKGMKLAYRNNDFEGQFLKAMHNTVELTDSGGISG